MSNIRKMLIVIPVLLFVLACQLVTQPLKDVESGAATAKAFATQAGGFVTEVQGMATQAQGFATQAEGVTTQIAPFETMAATEFPSGLFDPSSPPLKSWKDIPVMPEAVAGDEADGMYAYKLNVASDKVQSFYSTQLPSGGWKQTYNIPTTDGIGISVYSKGSNILTITVSQVNGYTLVLLSLQ